MNAEDVLIDWLWEGADHGQDDRAREILDTLTAAGHAVVNLPEVAFYNLARRPVFASAVCKVQVLDGPLVEVWLADTGAEHDLNLNPDEARSLAAALLAAADASEATP